MFLPNILFAEYSDIINKQDLNCLKSVNSSIKLENYTDALLKAKKCKDEDIRLFTQWIIINKEDYFSLNSLLNYKSFTQNIILPKNFNTRIYNASLQNDVDPNMLNYESIGINAYDLEILEKYLDFQTNNPNFEDIDKNSLIKMSWHKGRHNFQNLKSFLDYYKNNLNENDIIMKTNQYLSNGDIKTANFLGGYIRDKDYKKLLKAITYLSKNYRSSISMVQKVPVKYQTDENLIYYLARYYNSKNQDAKVTKHILALKQNLKNPKRFTKIKVRNSRYHIEHQNYDTAYDILDNHQVEPGTAQYAELEWLSGWISLRFKNDPDSALIHFKNMYENVGYSISLSRASYWLARSYKALGDNLSAKKWFKIASSFSTTYYGQMALVEDTQYRDIQLPKILPYDKSTLRLQVQKNLALKFALYFQYLGYNKEAYKFAKFVIEENNNHEKLFIYLAIFKETNNRNLISKIARYATRKNVITAANYPIIEDVEFKNKSLAFAIIKQESGFNDKAISNKGAIGFMQLMPATARDVSRRLKLRYSYKRLRNDQKYNLELGSYYINQLLNKFDNSYILAVASYNAGPNNVKKWIKRNGDVRDYNDIYDTIDWVEKIPFPETRNYVQRILENMIIYLHILEEKN
ncbi:MAG: lytic transglycosylase domain-containing protein [Rickettsiales bacterium]|nr:lytic transglycosylase domain-containing protein [Rickettsiales bacterium]